MRRKIQLIVLGILLIVNILLVQVFYDDIHGVLTVAFLDIGQGDAIFIETPSGHQMLVDGGRNAKVLEALGAVMPWYDQSLDLMMATHPDADHIGGLIDVFKKYEVSAVMEPGIRSGTADDQAYVKNRDAERGKVILARRGQIINFGDGAYIKILFPDKAMNGSDTNSASIVAQLVYGDTEVLLTGDSPKSIEHYLVGLDGSRLKSDILKVGHHGSKTSSSQEFLAAVLPVYSVISVGKDNRYGHPNKETVDALNEADTTVLTTMEQGTIVFESDGKQLKEL